MATSYKAQAIAHELAAKLKERLPSTQIVTEGFSSTDNNPTILINDGTPAAGEANFVLKVIPVSWPLAQDILGNAALQYTPHIVQLCTEADPTAGAGADPTTRAQLLPVLGQALAMGCQLDWYETTNGTVPTVALLESGATFRATYYPDVRYPLISGQ